MEKLQYENYTVLVVDNDPSIRELLRDLLYAIGFGRIEEANNGADALNFFAQSNHEIDLILLDLEMPEMNGYEFLSAIRSLKNEDRFPPVIVVTAHQDQKIIKTAIDLGINGFLVKPFSRNKLEEHCVKALISPAIDHP